MPYARLHHVLKTLRGNLGGWMERLVRENSIVHIVSGKGEGGGGHAPKWKNR